MYVEVSENCLVNNEDLIRCHILCHLLIGGRVGWGGVGWGGGVYPVCLGLSVEILWVDTVINQNCVGSP